MDWGHLHPPDVLRVRGVRYHVPPLLKLNESFFLPVLKPKAAYAAVSKHYARQGYKMVWEERIENGLLGIRVWRIV